MLFTGARIGEACYGTVDGVHTFGAGVLDDMSAMEQPWLIIEDSGDWSPKNRSSYRRGPLPPGLMGLLGEESTTPGTVRRWFNKITPKHITPHSLRHAWRTMARQAGMDEMVAERLMGHTAGTRVSQIYGSYPDELLVSEARKVWLYLESQVIKAEGP